MSLSDEELLFHPTKISLISHGCLESKKVCPSSGWSPLLRDVPKEGMNKANVLRYLPSATKLRRLCFYRHLSVHRGEYLTRYTPPGPGAPPWTRCTPWDQVHPPGPGTPPRYGHCCGRYASYWNAFLYILYFTIMICRLWVVPREPGDPPESQQIGYVNVVPARNEIGTFDSFGDTVRKFNLHLRQRPLPGKLKDKGVIVTFKWG